MMGCNGKCYLSKKLKEQEKQDRQAPVSRTEKFDVAPFFVPKTFLLETLTVYLKTAFFNKDEVAVFSFHSSIFHPPSA